MGARNSGQMWTVFTSEMSASRSSSTNCISLFAGSILMGLWRQFVCQHRHEQRSGYECTGTRFHRARDAPDPEETDIAPVYRSRSSLPRFQSRRDPRMSLFGSRPPLHIKSSSAEFPLDTETLQSLTAWRILQVDWRVRLVRPAGADI